MVAQAFEPRAQEAKVADLQIQDHPGLHRKTLPQTPNDKETETKYLNLDKLDLITQLWDPIGAI